VTATFLLRVPFPSKWLWAWDSVLYARAIDDLSIGSGGPLEQRPHPPGYVFYVLAGRGLTVLFGDANTALVALSVLAGVLTVLVGYVIAYGFAGRIAGLAAGAALIADPVLWHASVIAYPYVLLALLSGVVGLALWRARDGTRRAFVLASLVFGLALGFRQDLALHVGVLWLIVAASRGWRDALAGGVAAAGASVLWLVPSAIASGGPVRYLVLVWAQALGASGLEADPLRAIASNAELAMVGLRWQLLWLWPLVAGGAVLLLRERRDAAAFLAAWIVPSGLALTLLHTGEVGYTLALAVPLAALVGVVAQRVARLPSRPLALAGTATVAALVALLGTTFLVGGGRFSARAVERHDAILETQVAYIRGNFAPSGTVLIGEANYMHAVRYLPEYAAVYHAPRRTGHVRRDFAKQLAGRVYAVLLDDSDLRLRRLAQLIRLPGDVDLYVISLDEGMIGRLVAEDDVPRD
jgi:hypothetical protein